MFAFPLPALGAPFMLIVIDDGSLALVSLIRMVAFVLEVVAEIALVVFTLMLVALVPIPVPAVNVMFPPLTLDEAEVIAAVPASSVTALDPLALTVPRASELFPLV